MSRHILTRDDAPQISFEDGVAIFPPMPALQPGQVVAKNTKVLIYQEFPSFSGLLRNVSRPPPYLPPYLFYFLRFFVFMA